VSKGYNYRPITTWLSATYILKAQQRIHQRVRLRGST